MVMCVSEKYGNRRPEMLYSQRWGKRPREESENPRLDELLKTYPGDAFPGNGKAIMRLEGVQAPTEHQ